MCDPELCDTEKSIATSSDYQAKNSDVDCTIVTGLSNYQQIGKYGMLLLMDALATYTVR